MANLGLYDMEKMNIVIITILLLICYNIFLQIIFKYSK